MSDTIWFAFGIGGLVFGMGCLIWAVRDRKTRTEKLRKVLKDYRDMLAEDRKIMKKNRRTAEDNRRMAARLDEPEASVEKLTSGPTIH